MLFAAAGHQVIAFEPMSANEQLLRRSLCFNAGFQDRVTYYTDILGDVSQNNCTIFSDNDNLGDGLVTCKDNFTLPDNYAVKQSGVAVTTIDDVLKGNTSNIIMVKIDVEGYEGHVFRGGGKTILEAHVPYLLFEFSYAWVQRNEGQPHALLARLVQEGYRCSFESFHGDPFNPLVFYAAPGAQTDNIIRNIFCAHASMLS